MFTCTYGIAGWSKRQETAAEREHAWLQPMSGLRALIPVYRRISVDWCVLNWLVGEQRRVSMCTGAWRALGSNVLRGKAGHPLAIAGATHYALRYSSALNAAIVPSLTAVVI